MTKPINLRLKKILELWTLGLSAGQISDRIPGLSRNACIGAVYRAGKRLLRETGFNPYARPDHALNVQNGKQVQMKKPKAPKAQKPPSKPKQVQRLIDISTVAPGERLPPLVKLDSRLWNPLPNTSPKSIMDLKLSDCRWPIDGDNETLFCGALTPEGKSLCKTHHNWGHQQKKLEPLNYGKKAA